MPFHPSMAHTLYPLFRVHSDVWGPAPHNSLKGHWYFLIFVDEATLYTWMYLLTIKFEVTLIVRHFCAMVHTEFDYGIQRFQLDNDCDFFDADLDSFFADRCILHKSSCVTTPEQNGMVERSIEYVTSTAHTLLLNYSVLRSYWVR